MVVAVVDPDADDDDDVEPATPLDEDLNIQHFFCLCFDFHNNHIIFMHVFDPF